VLYYRLAPEHPFPAAVEDASKVYHWLADRMNPAQIVFVGGSAGGGLVLATLHKMRVGALIFSLQQQSQVEHRVDVVRRDLERFCAAFDSGFEMSLLVE
jgi:acetyl esterase/lipase